MMHGHEKSDSVIVAWKPANKVLRPAVEQSVAEPATAEPVEPRAETEGNADQQSTCRAQSRISVSQALERIRKVARERKKERFTALFHHISVDLLEEAFYELKEDAAPGVDRLAWTDYEADLECKLEDLHDRVQRGAYRALPSRRVYIPKPGGRQRPLAVAALEDKIVQRAVVTLLNAIYEENFLGFSYGFWPGRGTHDALDALCVGIHSRKVSWILDADIRSFFDTVSQEWLIRFVEHRIGDRRIIGLIRKWLKAGVLEDGVVAVSDKGTGQGAVISPLLANIYLHYALDLWVMRWRRREATGDMIIVRYADDFIIGFQHEADARRFLDEMRERLRKFALSLHPEKTRLIEFGRFAAERRKRRGLGKPETFNFLGFTFICGRTRQDKFQIKRKTRRNRMRAKLKMIKEEMWRRMHQPIPEQGKWLGRVVSGYFDYHAVPTNGRALAVFGHHVTDLWRHTLRRRSQKDRITWSAGSAAAPTARCRKFRRRSFIVEPPFTLFDHLVGAGEQRRRLLETERHGREVEASPRATLLLLVAAPVVIFERRGLSLSFQDFLVRLRHRLRAGGGLQRLREPGRDRGKRHHDRDADALDDHELEHARVDGRETPILDHLFEVVGRHRHRRRQKRRLQRDCHQRAEPHHVDLERGHDRIEDG